MNRVAALSLVFLSGHPGLAEEASNPALPLPTPAVEEPAVPAPPPLKGPESYGELVTRDGTLYRNCKVVRSEPDALLVEHAGGMARLSFFDLPEKVQGEWGFDPFKAMEHFKAEKERERALRWRLFWERQQYESEQARQADEARLREEAAREWVPVEARILGRSADGEGFVAVCQRITFQPTKTRSTLGSVIDGPPKRVLQPFSDRPVVLRVAVTLEIAPLAGDKWNAYVEPASDGVSTYRMEGRNHEASVHYAVPAGR